MEDLFLMQANIYGRMIPSDETLWAVLYDLKTPENRIIFSNYSNKVTATISHRYNFHKNPFHDLSKYPSWQILELFELTAELDCIWEKQAEIVGLDIELFLQGKAINTWFMSTLGNFTNYNITAFVRSKHSAEKSTRPRLEKYPEYLEAGSYIEEFDQVVEVNALINPDVKALEDEAEELFTKMSMALGEGIEDLNKVDGFKERETFAYVCPFCGVFKLVKKGATPKDCGDPQCTKDYWKSQKTSRFKRIDWVHDPKARSQWCKGTCESRDRRLNSDHYCRSCWDENPL